MKFLKGIGVIALLGIIGYYILEILANPGDKILLTYVPIIVWIFLVTLFLFFLFRKYTFGNWTKENPNPYQNETLALPRGMLRGVLTLSVLYLVIIMEFYALNFANNEKIIAELLNAFEIILGFYFGGKVVHHLASVDQKKNEKMSEALKASAVASQTSDGTTKDFDDTNAEG